MRTVKTWYFRVSLRAPANSKLAHHSYHLQGHSSPAASHQNKSRIDSQPLATGQPRHKLSTIFSQPPTLLPAPRNPSSLFSPCLNIIRLQFVYQQGHVLINPERTSKHPEVNRPLLGSRKSYEHNLCTVLKRRSSPLFDHQNRLSTLRHRRVINCWNRRQNYSISCHLNSMNQYKKHVIHVYFISDCW